MKKKAPSYVYEEQTFWKMSMLRYLSELHCVNVVDAFYHIILDCASFFFSSFAFH